MKSDRKFTHLGYLAVAALVLLGGSSEVAAQEPQRGEGVASLATTAQEAHSWRASSMPAGKSPSRVDRGLSARLLIVEMPMESGRGSRAASLSFPPATEEPKDEPRALALPAPDASLTFPSERERYWRPRQQSAIPPTTYSGMYPGSRLRGPFDQTYPRPFPGGGQP